MKSARFKKVLGISLGERSLLVAELFSAGNEPSDKPEIRQLAALPYPENVSLDTPAELGAALSAMLREKRINTSAAVVGLPAKWIVASTKESPDSSVDLATRNDILRLSAESEFSSELRDLVYDYVGDSNDVSPSVLLLATQRRNVELILTVAKTAKLKISSILPSAVALGDVTTRGGKSNGLASSTTSRDALVLAVGASGAELTAQRGGHVHAMRHLRATNDNSVSVSDLRRAVSMLPSGRGSFNGNGSTGLNGSGAKRELVIWNATGLDTQNLSMQTGLSIRAGELSGLGVRATDAATTSAAEFAPAVALAVVGLRSGTDRPAVDFLHSRLAPVVVRKVPRWAIIAAVALVVVIAACIKLYADLQKDRRQLAADQAQADQLAPRLAVESAFVNNVSFAQGWHGGDPRYLACVRDLTFAIPDDGQTIATQLTIHEAKPTVTSGGTASAAANVSGSRTLVGQLSGKTTDQQNVQTVLNRMRQNPAFRSAKLGGTQDIGKGREVTFSVNFEYLTAVTEQPTTNARKR